MFVSDSRSSRSTSYKNTISHRHLAAVMWKRKLEAKATETVIFYGSGSGKREMNGSGNGSRSSKKILDFNKVEAEAAILEAEAGLFQNSGSRSGSG